MEFNEALKASLKLEDDMTEEQAILERSKDRVAEIMGNPGLAVAGVTGNTNEALTTIARTRRTRSDAGTKRPKPEVEKVTALRTDIQWRVEELMAAESALTQAKIHRDRKWAEYCEFVDKALCIK